MLQPCRRRGCRISTQGACLFLLWCSSARLLPVQRGLRYCSSTRSAGPRRLRPRSKPPPRPGCRGVTWGAWFCALARRGRHMLMLYHIGNTWIGREGCGTTARGAGVFRLMACKAARGRGALTPLSPRLTEAGGVAAAHSVLASTDSAEALGLLHGPLATSHQPNHTLPSAAPAALGESTDRLHRCDMR